MKIVPTLLWGSLLLNTKMIFAQSGRSSGQALPQLFSIVARAALTDTATTEFLDGEHGPARKNIVQGRSDNDKSGATISEEALKICCEKVENDKRRIYYLSTRNGRMIMQVKGIYTRGVLLFFHLSLCNRSHLDYDMDSIRFFIADKGGMKNVPSRVMELKPVYVYGNMKSIQGKSREPSVIALRRFTLPPGKRLLIEAREKNGGRHLQLQADNTTLVRARLI